MKKSCIPTRDVQGSTGKGAGTDRYQMLLIKERRGRPGPACHISVI